MCSVLLSLKVVTNHWAPPLLSFSRSKDFSKSQVEFVSRRRIAASSNHPIAMSGDRKLPVLLFDVMDTLVRDPFYHDVPAFFRFCFTFLQFSCF